MDIRVLKFKTEINAKGQEVHWVLYGPSHSLQTSQTWAKISDLNPANIKDDGGTRANAGDKKFHLEAVWSIIEPHYSAWLRNEEIPEGGTALAAWAGVNDAQADVLKASGIRSVEELATLPEGAIEKIRLPSLRMLRELAQEYVENKGQTENAKALKEAQETANEAVKMMAEMKEQMEAQSAKIAELEAAGKPKPKRQAKKENEAA
jgi:hypothetical protein